MPGLSSSTHDVRWSAKVALCVLVAAVVLIRAALMIRASSDGDESALLAFPLTAVFPATLVLALATMPPAVSREGALMRIGTMVQCIAIIGVPKFALHLALGLPVVFLIVELFETRCPARIRDAVARRIVT